MVRRGKSSEGICDESVRERRKKKEDMKNSEKGGETYEEEEGSDG